LRLAALAAPLVLAPLQSLSALAGDALQPGDGMSRGWTFSEQGGERLFANVCAGCHQTDARGATGAAAYPSLADDAKLGAPEFVLGVLLGGLKAMPPVGEMMSDSQVADVANYVRTHFDNRFAGDLSAADVAAARRTAKAP
jgi:mono/diheme cytochrome c family protein